MYMYVYIYIYMNDIGVRIYTYMFICSIDDTIAFYLMNLSTYVFKAFIDPNQC